jgi:quercetin 2,3-dioxygenase
MIIVRKSADRGHAHHGWLNSKHTFSFADYHDASHMGFASLRVINEDRIEGGSGFGLHGHQNMEIVSYVISGALRHKDSMGNSTLIRPGEVQLMSAGTGVRHSEHNEQSDKETHFLQIWIMPEKEGIPPGYGQKSFEQDMNTKNLVLALSKTGEQGSIPINANVKVFVSKPPAPGEEVLENPSRRPVWIQVVKGPVQVEDESLDSGDGAAATGLDKMKLTWERGAEFITFVL